jgi:uncharacterized membrane protein YbhN (UPF0104 family)
LALGFSVSPLVAYLVVRDMDWSALFVQLRDFPLGYAIASLLIFSVATAVRAYRWQVLFVGEKVPLHRLLLVQNAGIGLNSLSPIRVISEAAQYVLLTLRYQVKKESVAATLGVQRVLDFVISALLLGVGFVLLPGLKGFALYILGAEFLAILSLLAVPAVIWFGARPGLARVPMLASTAASLRRLLRARLKLMWSFLLTLSYWLILGLAAWVLAYGMGIEISLLLATLLVIATLTFVALVPSLPASIGTFEFAAYYLLSAFGVGPVEALGYALVIHAILFLPPILVAFLVMIGWLLKKRAKEAGAPATGESPPVSSA